MAIKTCPHCNKVISCGLDEYTSMELDDIMGEELGVKHHGERLNGEKYWSFGTMSKAKKVEIVLKIRELKARNKC